MRIPPKPPATMPPTSPQAPSTPVAASRASAPTGGTLRDPKQAVAFVSAYHQRLDLPPERLKEKLALMRESASMFFRAMPALFHDDLRGPWGSASHLLDRPAPRVLVVGDAHVGNLGTFRGPEGRAVWGLNDFDQAGTGSPEVDLTRMATSAVLTAREAGLGDKDAADVAEAFGKAYFQELKRLAGGGDNPGAFITKKEAGGDVDDLIQQARDTSPKKFLEKLVRLDAKGGPRFKSSDSLKPVDAATKRALSDALGPYEKELHGADSVARPLKVLDWAQRLDAGGSSYGLGRYYALLQAADPKQPPVLLELKELLAPGIENPPEPADGQAVMEHQKDFGCDTNPLTGFTRVGGRAYLVREVEPEKARLDSQALNSKKELLSAFEQAAVVLARAHGATPSQAKQLADWVGKDDKTATKRLVAFAKDYADQTQADWKAFRAAS